MWFWLNFCVFKMWGRYETVRQNIQENKYNKTLLYQEMGASRSTGFLISNDRAGAHCSSLNPGVTLTRVLPLCKCKFEWKNIYINTDISCTGAAGTSSLKKKKPHTLHVLTCPDLCWYAVQECNLSTHKNEGGKLSHPCVRTFLFKHTLFWK